MSCCKTVVAKLRPQSKTCIFISLYKRSKRVPILDNSTKSKKIIKTPTLTIIKTINNNNYLVVISFHSIQHYLKSKQHYLVISFVKIW